MKTRLSVIPALLLVCRIVSAQSPGNAPAAKLSGAPPGIQTADKPIGATEESSILRGAELKTEWANVRNPFRFEVNDTPSYAPDRLEQMQVLGWSKMPDERGALQTYAFVTKTTEGARVEGNKLESRVTKDVRILQALPEKLDEQTVTTEEQIEESSIALGNEQLWFLGVLRTNSQAVAIFMPDNAAYPIQEEDLRPFEIQDSLKDLHVRSTKAGEKITTADNALRTLSRRKAKNTPATPAPRPPTPPGKPMPAPPDPKPNEKPTVPPNAPKTIDGARREGTAKQDSRAYRPGTEKNQPSLPWPPRS
ncbi:MAG TPA: hypothetical protein PKI20_01235 [Verrucomicrobiota bacterium]|nr:hypothetical protein [Verrucomicrobiota bacterium]